jgi:hypothetical protein
VERDQKKDIVAEYYQFTQPDDGTISMPADDYLKDGNTVDAMPNNIITAGATVELS